MRGAVLGRLSGVILILACACGLIPADAVSQEGKNPLWVVEKGEAKVYLLGSIHLMKASSYPLSDAVEEAYRNAGEIVFEADMRAMNRADTQVRLSQMGAFPAGQTLKTSVSAATYDRLMERFTKAGVPAGKMERYRPWFCGITLTMLEIRRLGYDLRHGAAQHFFARAVADGKRIGSLESLDEQFAMFSGLSPAEDEELLLQTLDDLDMAARHAESLKNAWKGGDMATMTKLLHASLNKHPMILERMISARNRAWMPGLEGRLQGKGSTLFVVGTAHLLGAQGLLKLLEDKGFSIRQL